MQYGRIIYVYRLQLSANANHDAAFVALVLIEIHTVVDQIHDRVRMVDGRHVARDRLYFTAYIRARANSH